MLRRGSPWILTLALLVTLIPAFGAGGVARAATVPSGFVDEAVTTAGQIPAPTALAFTPDGRMLITTQQGKLFVRKGASLYTAMTIPDSRICTNSERGLLGVAVDPAFATTRHIYVYYTAESASGGCTNRVSRFTLSDANTVNLITEFQLLNGIPSPAGNHNAGDLFFGRDGYLYISVGDGGCDYRGDSGCAGANDAARDRHVLLGKILRIKKERGIPADNPWVGTGTEQCSGDGRTDPGKRCQETFAWGLRNPFRMALDPNSTTATRFFINDVGQNAYEEVDSGLRGADYGWNCYEGNADNPSDGCSNPSTFTKPIYAYSHGTGCQSITGGAFVPNGVWPSTYNGSYLFADYVCGKIFRRGSDGRVSEFATGLGNSSAVHMTFGTFGGVRGLYYTTYNGGGQVRRIRTTSGSTVNNAPTAAISASPTSGPTPLNVRFSAAGSKDPDGDPLTYKWDFTSNRTTDATTATTSHSYVTPGIYTVTLNVYDNKGASDWATTKIYAGNSAPTPEITAPASGTLFSVGQSVTFQGKATDAQDGAVPASRLSWRVLLHHDNHTHPYEGPVAGSSFTFTAPQPEDLRAAATSYLRVYLKATDSQGASKEIERIVNPRKVNLTFATQPAGLTVTANGEPLKGSTTVTSWHNYRLTLNAPEQQDSSGKTWVFKSWSDSGAQTHSIVTGTTAQTYTATFVQK
jgi:glucose/arabinose dehydrogenase